MQIGVSLPHFNWTSVMALHVAGPYEAVFFHTYAYKRFWRKEHILIPLALMIMAPTCSFPVRINGLKLVDLISKWRMCHFFAETGAFCSTAWESQVVYFPDIANKEEIYGWWINLLYHHSSFCLLQTTQNSSLFHFCILSVAYLKTKYIEMLDNISLYKLKMQYTLHYS